MGRVVGTHGIKGDLKVEPLTDDPERFSRLSQVLIGEAWYAVRRARVSGTSVLLRLGEIVTPEAAASLRGQYLYIDARDSLPLEQGAYYHFQIIGLRVTTTDGRTLGVVSDVLTLQSNDVYVVRGESGDVLIPATRDVVTLIDLEGGSMVVEPVAGLLPETDEQP